MIQTVRVHTHIGPDLKGESVLSDIRSHLGVKKISSVKTAILYRIDGIDENQARTLITTLLVEDINQRYTLNKPLFNGKARLVEIAYKPGVMNPEVASIMKAAHDLGITPTSIETSREYAFEGNINGDDITSIIHQLNLYNPTIEQLITTQYAAIVPIQTMSEKELMEASKDKLFLNLEEMKIIQKYFKKIKRNPTDCELETLAQTWSEHCAHKTFKASLIVDGNEKKPLIKRIQTEALKHNQNIVSAFVDNSGVMDFYDDYAICGKVETHNSPSAIEPYGGAMTGSGGVFRDVVGTGQGAKNIASTDMFCFAPFDMDLKKLPSGCLPPSYLLRRVVTGVRDYGNRMGIPTNNGSVHFHEDFKAKPTVIVGAYGIIPKKRAQKGQPQVGDVVIAVGGRTGRDGIHGATFSSGEMTDRTINVNASAVQIGNAIEEKRMFDAIIEARDADLIRAMQDCGAGGFSSAIGEMGEKTGVTVHLEKAPLKYEGLLPWEIWVSESQERMVIATSRKNVSAFLDICKKYNVEATVLGTFDGSKKLQVFYYNAPVCILDMQFLHKGLPQRKMIAKKPKQKLKKNTPPHLRTEKAWVNALQNVLMHGNVCSKEPIVRLYDHSVQGTNDLQPYSGEKLDGPNDAVVLRPFIDKEYGMVISHGLNPILNRIDPYWGSLWAATEAIANYVAVGGNYKNASLINNYIWPFPDEESLWSLDKSVDAVVDFMKLLKIPVISGKDSLSSTYRGNDGTVIKIPPVLCISVFGKIPHASHTITADFKKTDSVIYLVGNLDRKLGGSVYLDTKNVVESEIPHVDVKNLPLVLNTLYHNIQLNQLLSVHDVSEGGVINSIFEMCVGGDCGAILQLRDKQPEELLFNETAGCFLVEVENETIAQKIFNDIPHTVLGKTQKKKSIDVQNNSKKLFSADVYTLKKSWQQPMKKLFP